MNINQQSYIKLIVDELEKGNVRFKEVYSVFFSKFQLSEKTFSKYWQMGNDTFEQQSIELEKAKAEVNIQMAKEETKALRMDRVERVSITEDRIIALMHILDNPEYLVNDYLVRVVKGKPKVQNYQRPLSMMERVRMERSLIQHLNQFHKLCNDYVIGIDNEVESAFYKIEENMSLEELKEATKNIGLNFNV